MAHITSVFSRGLFSHKGETLHYSKCALETLIYDTTGQVYHCILPVSYKQRINTCHVDVSTFTSFQELDVKQMFHSLSWLV